MSVLHLDLSCACLVLLVWVSIVCRVPGVFRPLSCCSTVLFCDKWLFLACVILLVVLVVSVLSETPTEGPFPSLFVSLPWSLSVLVVLSSCCLLVLRLLS